MKILIDASAAYFYHSTGIGAYAAELLSALKELPIGKHISVFNGRNILPLLEKDEFLPSTQCDFWEQTTKTPKDIGNGFDLYHNLHNGIGMKNGSKKTVITVHDMIPRIFPQFCGSPYKELFLSQSPQAIATCDHIITVSENSKKDILQYNDIPSEKISVIAEAPKHHCRPLPAKMCEDYLNSKYHIKPPFFLYVGGFNRRKNVSGLIRGYASIYRQFPQKCPLIIIGPESNRRKELEKLAEELNLCPYVYFPGYVPNGELPFFYNICEAFLYPSFYEGFGLPPLEAAACKSAVITSNRSSLREVMADGALYIDPADTGEIGNQLLALAKDEKQKRTMAQKAYLRSKEFSYQKTAEATAAIYENLCR